MTRPFLRRRRLFPSIHISHHRKLNIHFFWNVVPQLAGQFILAVAAEGWPSLEDVFNHAGMRQHFSAFVISSQLWLVKPDPRIIQATVGALVVSPVDALYVDDSQSNCDTARQLGLRTALLCRDGTEYLIARLTNRRHRVIRSLTELLE